MTTAQQLSQSLDQLGSRALRIKEQRDALVDALIGVREMSEGYMDVSDGGVRRSSTQQGHACCAAH